MSDPKDPSSDEATLKASLRRGFGSETAPFGLRQRVLDALDRAESDASIVTPAAARWTIFRTPLVRLAAAALIIFAIGIAVWQSVGPRSRPVVAALPAQFTEAMVQAHEDAASKASGSKELSPVELREIAGDLRTELNHPVLAEQLGNGWVARSSRIATVYGVPTAQVTYTRGANSVSLFSVTVKRLYSPAEGATYKMNVNGHALAGFVRHRTIHCVVGDSGTSAAEVNSLADSLAKL